MSEVLLASDFSFWIRNLTNLVAVLKRFLFFFTSACQNGGHCARRSHLFMLLLLAVCGEKVGCDETRGDKKVPRASGSGASLLKINANLSVVSWLSQKALSQINVIIIFKDCRCRYYNSPPTCIA